MILNILIAAIVFACALYYIACFLHVFGLVKWIPKHINVSILKMLIPFYYFFKNAK